MSVTDPIADMFAAIGNASRAKKEKLEFPSSKLKQEILGVLKAQGYIKNYKHISDDKQGLLRVYLRFNKNKRPAISNIKRISKPGLRVYVPGQKVPKVLRGMGMAIISSSSGVITDNRARDLGVGGEVIGYVW